MTKIKVLQIVGEPVGGIRKHIHSIIKGVDKNNFEIYYSYSNLYKDLTFESDINSMNILDNNQLKLKVYKKPHVSDIFNIYKLVKFIKKNSIEIVHGHGAKGGMYARVVKLFTNVKTIYTPHGGVLHNSFGKMSGFIYTSVEIFLIPLTDIVVVESNYSKNKYIEKIADLQEKLILNYNGVSRLTEKIENSIPNILLNKSKEQVALAIFARLHDMKGQDIVIQALRYLPDNYILHLFGEGEKKESLKNLVDKLNLQQRVYFHGETIYPEHMMEYIDIIIVPSSFESFSYVAAEGLMMKKLVIANKVGGLKEVLAENSGILIDEIDEHKLFNCIKRLTKEMQADIILNGYKRYLQYFQESKMVSSLENIYKKLIY